MSIAGYIPSILLGIAATVTLAICLNAFAIGTRLSVLAHPDHERKFHKMATPQVGGIAILAGLVVWIGGTLLTDGSADRSLLYALGVSAVGVGVVGFADDQTGLSPIARIIMVLVFLGAAFTIDRGLASMRLYWGSFEPSAISLWAYVPLMAFTAGGVVNAVNMADGQDGIVGSMFVVWTGCLWYVTGGTSSAAAAVLCITSAVFLVFNLRRKLFLGDCGSYGVSFVIGLMVALAHARGQVTLETAIVWFFIPVTDCLRLLISRPVRGRSPFLADHDHFHHRLEDKMGKQQGLIVYAGAVAVSSLVATLEPRFALVSLCVLSAFYFSFAGLTDTNPVPKQKAETIPAPVDNVVSLSSDAIASHKRKGAV